MNVRVTLPDGRVHTACFMVLRNGIRMTPCKESPRFHADVTLGKDDEVDLAKHFIRQAVEMGNAPKPGKVRGLGDLVAQALAFVGIRKKKGCKCQQRQEMLNRAVPFGGKK
jgi:hypothetical protein